MISSADTDFYIGKDVFGNDIYLPSGKELRQVEEDVNTIIVAIGFFMSDRPVSWAAEVLLTDESTVGDFALNEKDVKMLGVLLDQEVRQHFTILGLAQERALRAKEREDIRKIKVGYDG
jgi:hypothetical protein